MGIGYNKLKAIGSNVSRQNQFSCDIVVPKLAELSKYSTTDFNKLMNPYITNASIPSLSLNLVEIKYLNKVKYAVIDKMVDSVNITFMDNKKQDIRNMFIIWSNAIIDNTKHGVLKYYPSDYQSPIGITVHDIKYRLNKCTPTNIGDYILDHNNTDSIGTFSVTFLVQSLEIV